MSADAALDDSTIGVALSGGGVRAALFCAGALRAIVRHAEFKDKQLAVSGVSGSALLAFETAWSSASTDEEALEEAIERIVKYGYWLGRRWWAIAVVVLLSVSIAFPILQGSGSSTAGLLIAIGIAAVIAGLLAIGLFRTQGIFYRARPVAWHPLPIYSARPSQFGRAPARRLTLDHVVLNATSLNDGSYVSFDRRTFPTDIPVSRLAEASAAFPGVFLPRRLPGRVETLADGGVHDNTGLTYFRRAERRPELVLAIDAGVSSQPPTGTPYSLVLAILRRAPSAIWILMGSVIGSAVVSALLKAPWLSALIATFALVAFVATIIIVIPIAIVRGFWTDLRWLGRGWPITVRVASDLHREVFTLEHAARGGAVLSVKLESGPEPVRAKTQLWRLKESVARQLVGEGQRRTEELLRGWATLPAEERPSTYGIDGVRGHAIR
ncbi:hypothetical protein GCM10023066_28500 [Nocardioides kongjuensis]